jgi:hypothetical protein
VAGLEELSPLIAATIKNAVTDALNQQQKEWDEVQRRPRRAMRPINIMADLKEGVVLDASTKTYEDGLTTFTQQSVKENISLSLNGPSPEVQYFGTRSITKTQTTWRQAKFWFGTLHIHGTLITVQKEGTKPGHLTTFEKAQLQL